jgi:hypothetical protein
VIFWTALTKDCAEGLIEPSLANFCVQVGILTPSTSIRSCNATIIIDEAQETYRDQLFWIDIIKSQLAPGPGLRLCLFSSYW